MILRISLISIAAIIAYLSLSPSTTISMGSDKVGHFIAYFVLTLNGGLISVNKRKSITIYVLGASLYGVLMEIGQYFVPGRFTSFFDILANLGGVLLAVIILVLFRDKLLGVLTSLGIK